MNERELYEFAAVNRTRIDALDAELSRMRNRMHQLESTASVIRWYGEKVDKVADQIAEVADKMEKLSRRVVERPSVSAWGVIVQVGSLLVAIAAIVIATQR